MAGANKTATTSTSDRVTNHEANPPCVDRAYADSVVAGTRVSDATAPDATAPDATATDATAPDANVSDSSAATLPRAGVDDG